MISSDNDKRRIRVKAILAIQTIVAFCFVVVIDLAGSAAEDHAPNPAAGGLVAGDTHGSKAAKAPESKGWSYRFYLDSGYAIDANHPENGLWRSKSTTFEVDDPKVNMAMAYLRKDATPRSRWGIQLGVQGGVDTKKLAPDDDEAISNADFYRHLYRANMSYLFAAGNGLEVTGGLINSYIGYESYLAIENRNYTRGYITDNVPYFFFGAGASYPLDRNLNLAFYAVNGWNYLANPNDQPSWGLQLKYQASKEVTLTQNLYYGPDQEDSDLEFWRFFSDTILEWKRDPLQLAVAFDFGTEKQAAQPGNPRDNWIAGALWAGWHVGGPWHLALRSEFYQDPDGLITGAQQFIQAHTATLQYKFSAVEYNKTVVSLEYRFDRSTGSEGGFFKGSDNRLTPNQHLLILALMWSFGS